MAEMPSNSPPLSSSLPLLPFPLLHRDSVPETIEVEDETGKYRLGIGRRRRRKYSTNVYVKFE